MYSRINTLASLVVVCLSFINCFSQDRLQGKLFATRSEVIAQNGMVATSHPLATQIGIDILKKGGNAVDAAIACNAALGFMEPTGCGIGGDIFAIVWDAKNKKLHGLNGSGRSPMSLTMNKFKELGYEKIPSHGPLSISVPGAVDGWFALHGKFGSLPMATLLQPAIEYAEKGVPLPQLISNYLRAVHRFIKEEYKNIKETYLDQNGGKLPKEGEIYKNPFLANTYRTIAEEGRDGFYRGKNAKIMTDFVKSQGGFLSMEDLASHTSEWVEPVSINYRGYDIWELPPNGQGIAALQMLNILEEYDFSKIQFGSAEHIHLFTEAKKLAFEDRAAYYTDPHFADIPVEKLLSDSYAQERKKLIGPEAGIYKAGVISPGETIYLTVADRYGNMISLIQSNFRGMGSGMVPPGLGFMFQDRGELFSLTDGHANQYEPGKRPFQTIIPGFITKDNDAFLSFGVMGGDFQPMGHVQIVMNIIDFGMNIQEAGDAPRWEHVGSSQPTGEQAEDSGEIRVESGIDFETIRELIQKKHKVSFGGYFGGYQAIRWDAKNKVYRGASESRKDGQAAGY